MTSLEKIAVYLNSFDPQDPNFDFACYIKEKVADSVSQLRQNEMHEEENNESNQMETPEVDKTNENVEGKMMEGAFQDLDVLNQLQEEKQEIKTSGVVTNLLQRLRSN